MQKFTDSRDNQQYFLGATRSNPYLTQWKKVLE